MAPPKASSKAKYSSLTQSKLDFRAGRAPTTRPLGKPAAGSNELRPSLSATPSGGSSGSSSDIGTGEEKEIGGSRPRSKRHKLDLHEYDIPETFRSERASVNGIATPAGAEPEHQPSPPVAKPKLNVQDKKYSQQYAKIRRKMGNLKPIHSNGLDKIHHILRMFDLSYEYGPCVGVTRLERWERAEALGLNPPPEVKDILMTQEAHDDDSYRQNVFYGYEV